MVEHLDVVAVEGFQRGLQFHRQAQGVEPVALAATLLRHPLADVLPQFPIDRHIVAGDVVGHRHARQLDDAALDGVHQGEVAHRPREQGAFGIARSAQEERRGRQVEHARQTEFAVHRFETGNPQTCGFVVLLGLLAVVALEVFVFVALAERFLAVAVVGFVVDGEDVLQAHQLRHHALEHLTFGFQRLQFLAAAPLQQAAATTGDFQSLTQAEGVVVGDDDDGAWAMSGSMSMGTSSRLE